MINPFCYNLTVCEVSPETTHVEVLFSTMMAAGKQFHINESLMAFRSSINTKHEQPLTNANYEII
jgi:hypothetical protein